MPQRERLPTVLVVDDDRVTADGIVRALQENSFQAYACYSAQNALSAADLQQPDIAVIEVVLPDLDGVRLARRIQLLSPAIRILLMCSRPEAAGTLDTYEFEVLTKPTPGEVVAQLRALANANSESHSSMRQPARKNSAA